VSTFSREVPRHTASRARRKCVRSLCTRGALDTWSRGRSTAALDDMVVLMSRNVVIVIMGLLSFLFGSSSSSQPTTVRDNPDAGRGLRQMMLSTPAARFGASPTSEFPRVYGVLIDWPIGEQIATIFSSSSGAASLYTTSTFGIVGGEGHQTVRAAAIELVRVADRFFESAVPTTEFPYPTADRVRFYLLTFEGVRVIDTDIASIENQTSRYFAFFDRGQAVLTELRVVTER
jgi:hypothetical protein